MKKNYLSFEQHEDKGRDKMRRVYNVSGIRLFTFYGQDSKIDTSFTADTKYRKNLTANVEIKDRDIEYTKYPNYWLEKIKYDALVGAYKETGSLPIYLNFFKNNIGFYWNLLKIQPKWVWRLATETTADGTYGQNKVWKLVTFVYPEEGKRFKYE